MREMLSEVKVGVYLAIFVFFLLMLVARNVTSQFMYGIVAYVSFFASLLVYGWLQDKS